MGIESQYGLALIRIYLQLQVEKTVKYQKLACSGQIYDLVYIFSHQINGDNTF